MAILVVATKPSHIDSIIPWAWQIAKAKHEGLTIVAAAQSADSVAEDIQLQGADDLKDALIESLKRVASEYVSESIQNPDVSDVIVRRVLSPHLGKALLGEVNRIDPSLLIVPAQWAKDGEERTLAQYLYAHAPSAMMIVNGEISGVPKNILVPTSEGRNAREALLVAASLAQGNDGVMTAFSVQPTSIEGGEDVGLRVLGRAIAQAGLSARDDLTQRVEVATKIPDGIRRVVSEYDAVLMGASERGLIYRALFGTLPDELVRGSDARLLAVVRARRRWGNRLRDLFDRLLHLWVPQMDRATRISVYDTLQTGSRWGFDFMMLIALSTSIAALGLIQSSAAVVIGAMLVAPLMTPMLGAGLALLQGNRLLLREAGRAIGLGFCLALFIGCLVGLLSPVKVLTPEMSARGAPTLLDLSVALLAGFAAAYAYARPHLLAALPGVAIAAALVPPIATTGVCLSIGEIGIAAGAALLFGTNVVAIVVGATIAFYSFGLRGRVQQRTWVSRAFLGLVILMLVLAIPLSTFLWSLAQRSPTGLTTNVRETAAKYGFRLMNLEHDGDVMELKLQGAEKPSPQLLAQLDEVVAHQFGRHIRLRVVSEFAVILNREQSGAAQKK